MVCAHAARVVDASARCGRVGGGDFRVRHWHVKLPQEMEVAVIRVAHEEEDENVSPQTCEKFMPLN